MEQDFFKYQIDGMKQKYPSFRTYQDYHVFTIMCAKYYYFSESGIPFDQDLMEDSLTDGANDGGIDAIFNDPNSEGNDVIVVQSKYYDKTGLNADNVVAELFKIKETLNKLASNKIETYNDKLVSAYRNATSHMEDDGIIRITFFTSFQPKNKQQRNKIEKAANKLIGNYELDIYFGEDIESQIEMCDFGKRFVDFDKLIMDKKDNYLEYQDSIIINVSALSLQDLYNRRRNGLLGMNLRYYIRQKVVDTGIESTIKKEPENFWYKNNGILIICEDYELDGKEIKLYKFSIVNGGQTTNRIGKLDIEKDFYVQCKVIKSIGETLQEKDKFTLSIAEATNSQKPIKKADLKANTPEQISMKERLNRYHVYYITKKGDKTPKQFSEPYQTATLEQVGKLSMASVLQMPGSARSNSQKMYSDEYYYSIFGTNAKEGVIADLLKISYYYDRFLKNSIKGKGYDEKTVLPMMKNGRTYQFACITFLCKLQHGIFEYDTIAGLINNTDGLKVVLRDMGNMDRLIYSKTQNEEELFSEIFAIIGDEVLGYCFGDAIYKAEQEQRTIAPSDYLKSDINYYKDVIKRLWNRYNGNKKLKENIQTLSKK